VDPPAAEADRHLRSLYENGTTVAFGDEVTYVCEEGFYFEEDFHMEGFDITCLSDGSWSPLPDKRCLDPECESAKSNCYYSYSTCEL
jgi:hypothetical protein